MGVESAIWHHGQLHGVGYRQQCLGKEVGNSSYVDVNNFGKVFGKQHFDERFDVNLEVAKAQEDVEEISEDRRWPRQVWTSLPEKF